MIKRTGKILNQSDAMNLSVYDKFLLLRDITTGFLSASNEGQNLSSTIEKERKSINLDGILAAYKSAKRIKSDMISKKSRAQFK